MGEKEEEITQKTAKSSEKAIVPKYNISDSYYKMVLPFKAGKARGLTTEQLNTRLDIDEFETGLMRLAQDSFSTDDYLFQEGQYLDEDTVLSWLARKKTGSDLKKAEKEDKNFKNEGLNPALPSSGSTEEKNESSPIYLASMLEHDYLVRKDKNSIQLGGVMIGLALNSVYYYREKTGDPQKEVEIKDSTLRQQGEKIAQEVINRLRKKDNLKNVPITVALYKQASKTSIVPGTSSPKQRSKQALLISQIGMTSMKNMYSIRRIQPQQKNTRMTPRSLSGSKTQLKNISRTIQALSVQRCMKMMK